MGNMIIGPGELDRYFRDKFEQLLGNYLLIAENAEDGTEVYLTEEDNLPCFVVEMNGDTVYIRETQDMKDAERAYRDILALYIGDEQDTDPEMEYFSGEEIDRLADISCATEDLVTVLLEQSPADEGLSTVEIIQIAENVAQFLCEQYGISVWFPTLSIDEDGRGTVESYPYQGGVLY